MSDEVCIACRGDGYCLWCRGYGLALVRIILICTDCIDGHCLKHPGRPTHYEDYQVVEECEECDGSGSCPECDGTGQLVDNEPGKP